MTGPDRTDRFSWWNKIPPREDPPPTRRQSDDRLWLVAGGDTLYVFTADQEHLASGQCVVIVASNQEPSVWRVTPEAWEHAQTGLSGSGTEILDFRHLSTPPDAGCYTEPDGSCTSEGPCMHTPTKGQG